MRPFFCKKLYSYSEQRPTINLCAVFNKVNPPVLSNLTRDKISGPLTHEEILKVLRSIENGKSPGSDGFTFEFYKFFFSDLSWFLLRSLNFGYDTGNLSVTRQLGIITLLPKGDKPRQF